MENLQQLKSNLKKALPKEGINYVLKALKGSLPESAPKYNAFIQLESAYRDLKLQIIEGILDSDDIQRGNNIIRKRLLEFIDSLEEEDFEAAVDSDTSFFEPDQKIRRGHVLYRIPNTMQKEEETRCLVRIAFDKAMLVEDLDLDEHVEVRPDLRVSDYMKVEIIDPSAASTVFSIRTTSEPVQFIDKDDFTEWRFYVTPLQAGEHVLELKVTLMLMIDGVPRVRERTLEESVVIVAEPVEAQEEEFKQLEEAIAVGGGQGTATETTKADQEGRNVGPNSKLDMVLPTLPGGTKGNKGTNTGRRIAKALPEMEKIQSVNPEAVA